MTTLMDEADVDEVARRGAALYEERLKPLLEPEYNGQAIAIDVESGDYAVDPRWTKARQELRHRRPGARICSFFIGPPTNREFALASRMSGGRK